MESPPNFSVQASRHHSAARNVQLIPGIRMMTIPSPRRMPLKLPLRDHFGRPEQLLAQRTLVWQQLVAARSRMQAIGNDRTRPVFASLGPITIVERLRNHFVLPENRKSAKAKRIEAQRIRFPAIRAADPLVIRVSDRIGIGIEVERRQFRRAIGTSRRTIQRHQALCTPRVYPKSSASLQSAGPIEIHRWRFDFGTPPVPFLANSLHWMPAQNAVRQNGRSYSGFGAATLRACHRIHANLMATIFARI